MEIKSDDGYSIDDDATHNTKTTTTAKQALAGTSMGPHSHEQLQAHCRSSPEYMGKGWASGFGTVAITCAHS